MKKIYRPIWDLALPYLEKGLRKNLITHTKEVVNAMEILLKYEGGDENLLVPCAILHDIGWSKVPKEIQKNWRNKEDKIKGEKLHIEYPQPIIKEILEKLNYPLIQINKITEIVKAHKFQNPSELEKQLLIDADKMSDATKIQFYSDAEFYSVSPQVVYDFRMKNKFYTITARKFFEKEMENRRREFIGG